MRFTITSKRRSVLLHVGASKLASACIWRRRAASRWNDREEEKKSESHKERQREEERRREIPGPTERQREAGRDKLVNVWSLA